MKKNWTVYAFLIVSIFAAIHASHAESGIKHPATSAPIQEPVPLSREGKNYSLPSGGYLIWHFDKKPKMGGVILVIQTYSKAGIQETPYQITGEFGMPEMKAHDSGPVGFRLNKKGNYLLPIDVAMPGQWQVTIRIKRDGKQILVGKIDFAV